MSIRKYIGALAIYCALFSIGGTGIALSAHHGTVTSSHIVMTCEHGHCTTEVTK